MIDCSNVAFSLDAGLPENQAQLRAEVARVLGIDAADIGQMTLRKRSVDARKKSNVHFVGTFTLEVPAQVQEHLLAHPPKGVGIKTNTPYEPLTYSQVQEALAPVVVGAGPAGLFAALYLARCGLRPVVLERGAAVDERAQTVEHFIRTGQLDERTNIQFGEGGAGTFSDGKLTTNTKNRFTQHVLHWFVDAGAPAEVLWQAHPHIGSDNLPQVVRTMREEIIARGGQVLFGARLCDFGFSAGVLTSVTYEQDGQTHELSTNQVVLACGHSARDTFELCQTKGLVMKRKPFSVGVRIEHPQALINHAQWGAAAEHAALGAAEYKLVEHLPSGRNVYTFCMCPGGDVVAAASEQGGVVTNGMSRFARDGANANAALLVNVDPVDLPGDSVLAGVDFQRSIEQAAYKLAVEHGGQPYQAPAQRVGEFLGEGEASANPACEPTYGRGVVQAPLRECLPAFVTDALAEALPKLGRKLAGFDDTNALLTAPETRSSSPITIARNASLQAYFASASGDEPQGCGIYPCGEGPGFAGGIMSAACDGLRVASAIVDSLQ